MSNFEDEVLEAMKMLGYSQDDELNNLVIHFKQILEEVYEKLNEAERVEKDVDSKKLLSKVYGIVNDT